MLARRIETDAALASHHPQYTADDVVREVEKRRADEAAQAAESEATLGEVPGRFRDYRREIYEGEYLSLSRRHKEMPNLKQDFVCEPPAGSLEAVRSDHGIDQIMLVKRLRRLRSTRQRTRSARRLGLDA